MSKELINFNIKAETPEVKDSFLRFASAYNDTINQFINMDISNTGALVDASVNVVDGELVIYQLAPDKGFVLGETGDEELPVQVTKYTQVADGLRYIVPQKERLVLFLKEPSGKPDVALGSFKTLTDSIIAFNSEGVKNAINAWNERVARETKADEKAAKRLAKLTPKDVE